MRKRNHLIWPLGLALTLTVAGVAWANGTQSLTGGIKPTKLSKTTYKPVKLTLSAALSPQSPAPSDSSPSDVKLAFPRDIKFNASGESAALSVSFTDRQSTRLNSSHQ